MAKVQGLIETRYVNIAEPGELPRYIPEEVRVIIVNGNELKLEDSLKIGNHSPCGFHWGYGGSGPCQTALGIILELKGKKFALAHPEIVQAFKRNVIARLDMDDEFEIDVDPDILTAEGIKREVAIEWIKD